MMLVTYFGLLRRVGAPDEPAFFSVGGLVPAALHPSQQHRVIGHRVQGLPRGRLQPVGLGSNWRMARYYRATVSIFFVDLHLTKKEFH